MNVEVCVGDEDFSRDAAAQVFRPQQDGIGLEMSAHWIKASILRECVQSKWVHLLRFQRMFEKSWQIKTHGTRTRVPPAVRKLEGGNIVACIAHKSLRICERCRLAIQLRRCRAKPGPSLSDHPRMPRLARVMDAMDSF